MTCITAPPQACIAVRRAAIGRPGKQEEDDGSAEEESVHGDAQADKTDKWPLPNMASGQLEFFVERLIHAGQDMAGCMA